MQIVHKSAERLPPHTGSSANTGSGMPTPRCDPTDVVICHPSMHEGPDDVMPPPFQHVIDFPTASPKTKTALQFELLPLA